MDSMLLAVVGLVGLSAGVDERRSQVGVSPEMWVELDSRSCNTHESCAEWAANATDVFDLAARCRKCPLRVRLECAAQCMHAAAAAFNDTRPVTFTHIPKAAGTSFQADVKPRLGEQNCYLAMKHDGLLSAVMLRSPESHVRSQFGECYWDGWGHKVTKGTHFPRTGDAEADFISWVHHFATQPHYPGHDFRCINPREVQTRHMSCSYAPNPKANHALAKPPDVNVALYLLQDASFVGIADFYHSSVCLLRLRRTGFLPDSCVCPESAKSLGKGIRHSSLDSKKDSNHTHGVPHGWSSGAITDPRTFQLVRNYTALDARLFTAALRRFQSDVAVAERVAGRQILCADDIEKADAMSRAYPYD